MDHIALAPAPTIHEVRASAVHALMTALLVALGSCIRGASALAVGLPLTCAGLAAAARAVTHVADERRIAWLPPVSALLCFTALVGALGPRLPAAAWYDALYRIFFVLGAVAVGVLMRGDAPASRAMVAAVIVAQAALHLLAPIAVRAPHIDVFVWLQTCLQAL